MKVFSWRSSSTRLTCVIALLTFSVLSTILYYQGTIRFNFHTRTSRNGAVTLKSYANLRSKTRCNSYTTYFRCIYGADRLVNFCMHRVPAGDEGGVRLPESSDFVLQTTTAFINQADRVLPLDDLPDTVVYKKASSDARAPKWLDERAVSYAAMIHRKSVHLVTAGSDSTAATNNAAISDPATWFDSAETNITEGRITSLGFMQAFDLGMHLSAAYANFPHLCHNISMTSADSPIAIQTAVSLATTLCPTIKVSQGDAFSPTITVLSKRGGGAEGARGGEVMQQQGYAAAVLPYALPGETCEASDLLQFTPALLLKQEAALIPSALAIRQLRVYFGRNLTSQTFSHLIDHSLSRFCHGKSLPCTNKSTDSPCFKAFHLEEFQSFVDDIHCRSVYADERGLNASRLIVYPYLHKILGDSIENNSSQFSLHFDDQILISRLLAVFGLYSYACTRPGPATRLVVEVWSSVTAGDRSHVRLLYNGVDVTNEVPACVEQPQALLRVPLPAAPHRSKSMKLCAMSAIRRQVQPSYELHYQTCKTKL